jgi:hypothetical protein
LVEGAGENRAQYYERCDTSGSWNCQFVMDYASDLLDSEGHEMRRFPGYKEKEVIGQHFSPTLWCSDPISKS